MADVRRATAPRLHQRLYEAIEHHALRDEPIAEIARRVGAEADRLGLPRPSYERIRGLVHEARERRESRGPSDLQVLLEGSTRLRSFESMNNALATPRDERR